MDSEDMTTSISDLRNRNQNLAQQVEYEMDNYSDEQVNVVPQATLQKAPPMRHGYVDNYKTHQVVDQNSYYPRDEYLRQQPTVNQYQNMGQGQQKQKSASFLSFNGIFKNLYTRISEPIILTILFVIFAHRMTARGVNPYIPFVGQSPSTDIISLVFRGFVLSVVFMIIKNMS